MNISSKTLQVVFIVLITIVAIVLIIRFGTDSAKERMVKINMPKINSKVTVPTVPGNVTATSPLPIVPVVSSVPTPAGSSTTTSITNTTKTTGVVKPQEDVLTQELNAIEINELKTEFIYIDNDINSL